MKALKVTLATLFTLVAFGYAGRVDWSEQIVMSMPQEAYEQIIITLPEDASYYETAKEYMNNKEYYDKLSY